MSGAIWQKDCFKSQLELNQLDWELSFLFHLEHIINFDQSAKEIPLKCTNVFIVTKNKANKKPKLKRMLSY